MFEHNSHSYESWICWRSSWKMMAASSPTVTCLCSTVLEETDLTLSFERAEKTLHSCVSIPYKGVITVWWRLEVHGYGVGHGSEQNPRYKWRIVRKYLNVLNAHFPWSWFAFSLPLLFCILPSPFFTLQEFHTGAQPGFASLWSSPWVGILVYTTELFAPHVSPLSHRPSSKAVFHPCPLSLWYCFLSTCDSQRFSTNICYFSQLPC